MGLNIGLTMSSDARTNLTDTDAPARDDFLVVGARVSPEDVRLIDLARVTAGYANRSDFIVAAIVEKARQILDQPAKAS